MIINQNSGNGDLGLGIPLQEDYGVVSKTQRMPKINCSNVEGFGDYALAYAYVGNNSLNGDAFINAYNVTGFGEGCLLGAFQDCIYITGTGLNPDSEAMDAVISQQALKYAFKGCISLTDYTVGKTATVETEGFYGTFEGCTSLTGAIWYDYLRDIVGSGCFARTFANTGVTAVYFPALEYFSYDYEGDYPFKDMCEGLTGCVVHFPSNMEGITDGFENQFGGTNTTILFDLESTEPPEPEPEEPEEPPFEEEPIE